MKICYVHGHGASPASFNFIRSEIGDGINLEYDSKHGFATNLASMIDQLADETNIFFIAHSLGGLYALHLADKLGDRIAGAVTMGTPYAGCESAITLSLTLVMNLIKPAQLYRDIHTNAAPVTQARRITLPAKLPWVAIVTTKGQSQFIQAANDGVVSRASMQARIGARFVDVDSTHHEVLLSRRSVEIIKATLAEVEGFSKLAA